MIQSKTCRVCGETKPISEFYAMKGMRDGFRNDCKSCHSAGQKARYAKDPQKYIAMVRRWQQENSEYLNEYRRRLNATPERKRKARDAYYRRTYGISADEFDAMLEAQGGVCAICLRAPEREASWHLDHDHVTGEVRSITCIDCNQGMGKLRDDPELLERAAAYIRAHRAAG